MHKCSLTILLLLLMPFARASTEADQSIRAIYKKHLSQIQSLPRRIDAISALFLGKPYILGALGEGKQGRYDQSPLYRTDGFDCTTYVSTVVALSLSTNLADFKKKIIQVRYQQDKARYLSRNHFMSLDWIQNNVTKGHIKDITSTIKNKKGAPVYREAKTIIEKGQWLKYKKLRDIKLSNMKWAQRRLKQLHQKANSFPPKAVVTQYIPLTTLFTKGKPKGFLFNQIPDGSIIEIVRPNWQLKSKIGTNLNISHLGFAIRKNGQLFFREASSVEHKVIDIPLSEYLQGYLNSPTIKGISVLVIMTNQPQG